MTDELDVLTRLVDYHDHITAPPVPVADDVRRGRRRVARRRALAASGAAAAVTGIVMAASLLTGAGHDAAPAPADTSPAPSPTTTKTQGPDTWADTPVTATKGHGWNVPDPLDAVRAGWFQIVADHLRPSPRRAEWAERGQGAFELPSEGSDFATGGGIGVLAAGSARGLLADGCAYLHPISGDHRKESCRTEQIEGPNGERVHVSSFQSLCTTFDPGRPGDDARPAPGSYKNCGDYDVTVVVERSDGRIGYIDVQGRDYVEAMPFARADLAAAAADPRLALPDAAYAVPSDQTVAAVVADHFPTWREDTDVHPIPLAREPGRAFAYGNLAPFGLSVEVRPAGGVPACGRTLLVECVERRVFGADDPTTVYVGSWNFCCARDFPTLDFLGPRRELVYVGPRHTVVVSAATRSDPEPIIADLDQTLIDLALDPRLQ